MSEKITGAEALIKSLIAEGVDRVFGYPGGAIMPVYDRLYDYADQLKHILVRHEQGATHAAQGYARGDYFGYLYRIHYRILQGRILALESFSGFRLLDSRGLFCVYEVIDTILIYMKRVLRDALFVSIPFQGIFLRRDIILINLPCFGFLSVTLDSPSSFG